MNTGIFGEGFPYSNFHDLNMDWIIKIAKDFLDQYTHIQEIIEQGKTDIQELTESGLTQLQDKADALEELLQAWYNEHSEDIADQLADALADLNTWYTTHQDYLDATLTENITAFNTAADTKAALTIATIPDDYTALSNKVLAIQSAFERKCNEYQLNKFYSTGNGNLMTANGWMCTNKLFILPNTNIQLFTTNDDDVDRYFVNVWDKLGTFLGYQGAEGYSIVETNYILNRFPTAIYYGISYDATTKYPSGLNSTITENWYTLETSTSDRAVELIDSEKTKTYVPVALEFESQLGFYNENKTLSEYSGITGASINVAQNEKYLICGQNFYSMCPIVLFDNSDNVVSAIKVGSGASLFYNYEITIPATVTKMLIDRYLGSPVYVRKYTGYNLTPSPLKQKKITVIGDSITEVDNGTAEINWTQFISAWGDATIQNLGISGTGFYKNNPYKNRIASIDNPDIIGIACSFNDTSSAIPIGNVTDIESDNTLCGYINTFFETLVASYSTKPIICYCQGPWKEANIHAERCRQYIEKVKEICNLYGVPFYGELFSDGCVLRPWISNNRTAYYSNDDTGTHPDTDGHRVIAKYLMKKFEENI